MKTHTHQEIRDAIEKALHSYADCPKVQIMEILHALNDRIERHEKENVALFKKVHECLQKLS